MALSTPGVDCHIALSHPQINNGSPHGFLLDDSKEAGPAVSIQREAVRQDDGTFVDNQKFFFTVILGDRLPNPYNSLHQENAAGMYAALMQYLGTHSGLALLTPTGSFSGLFASGHYATEIHYPDITLVTVQMSNTGSSFDPVDVTRFIQSNWVDESVYVGEMTWDTTYWR
jgi:hypothetical protein